MMTLCAGLCYVQVKSTTTITMYCAKLLTTLNSGWQLRLSFDGIKLLPQTAGSIQYQKGEALLNVGMSEFDISLVIYTLKHLADMIFLKISLDWMIEWPFGFFWAMPKNDSFIHEINILGLDISSRMYNRFQLLPAPMTPANPITYWEEGKLITSVQGVQKAPSHIIVESADKVPAAHIESKLITSGRRGRPRGCAPFEHCALVN